MKLKIIIPIAIALAFGLIGRARAEETAATSGGTSTGPRISFQETVHDAGESWQGDQVSHVFTFTNTGDAELEITRVRSTCGCTASNLSRDRIAPGESGEIRATFNTRGYRGRKSQPILVSSNDSEQPTVQLRIETTVKTAAAFSPPNLQFGQVIVGQGAVRETALVFDGESFPVREISAQPEFFSARVLEPEGETGGDPPIRIEVALSPEAPVGRHRGTLTARLDHPRIKHLTGHLLVTVEGVITSSPRMLFFNREDQAEVAVKTVSVTNQGPEPVEIRNVSSSIPQFTAELKTIEPGREFEVSIRLSPETEPGRYNGEVKIETSLPNQAVIAVPLRANIVP